MEECNRLDSLIRQGRSFAIYRIPGETAPRFVLQNSGSARFLYHIEDLNARSGFVIAPFQVSEQRPIVLIRPDETELPALPALSDPTADEFGERPGRQEKEPNRGYPPETSSKRAREASPEGGRHGTPRATPQTSRGTGPAVSRLREASETKAAETKAFVTAASGANASSLVQGAENIPSEKELKQLYTNCFQLFTKPLLQGKLDKLVLSRYRPLPRPARFSPGRAFYHACRQYPRSYVYLCHTPQTGTWLGSTPEILLSGQAGAWHTVALAGTQPLRNGEVPLVWDDKNRREQQIVAAYIRKQLRSLAIRFEESEPYAARAGALSHLKSDFRFVLPRQNRLGDLLSLLHPTPAVCGLPKEEAYRFILRHEGYDRSYYSGFIGWLDPEGQSDLYVNLRCMHLSPERCTLYAGGGLLASSALEDEWQETEDKLQTMKWLLNMHAQLV